MSIITRSNPLRYLGPAIWGIASFNILRVVTDLTKKDQFWSGGIRIHSIGLFISIAFCYVLTALWRRRLDKIFGDVSVFSVSVAREYLAVIIQIVILLNPVIYSAEHFGWVYMGDGYIDYILVNAIYIPLFLLYYTLMRNEQIDHAMASNRIYVEKIKSDKLSAELQLLKSQYHPHFLFNALNTVYFQIEDTNTLAKRSIEQLSELLRYQIYNVDEKVSMDQEIVYIRSYVSFQRQRLPERLNVQMNIDPDWQEIRIFPLLFQPLIENAFKYVRGKYEIKIDIKLRDREIIFGISNSLDDRLNPDKGKIAKKADSGSGLAHLVRRLELVYPNAHKLSTEMQFNQQEGHCYLAELRIKI